MILEALAIGAALFGGAALVAFWDDIKDWLNNTAADLVERHFGYSARQNMYKAVAVVDRIVNKIRQKQVVYSKNSPTDTYYNKVTEVREGQVTDVDSDVLEVLGRNDNHLAREADYNKRLKTFEYVR